MRHYDTSCGPMSCSLFCIIMVMLNSCLRSAFEVGKWKLEMENGNWKMENGNVKWHGTYQPLYVPDHESFH